MRGYKTVSSLLAAGVVAASVSSAAVAGDRRHHDDGNGVAIAAGIIGAVLIGSLIASANEPAPPPQPAYVPPQPPPYPYYETQVQGYPPQYYAPQPGVYVEGGYRHRYGYRHDHYRY